VNRGRDGSMGLDPWFRHPLPEPVAKVHDSIEGVQIVGKSITTGNHRANHSQNSQAAVFDVAASQAQGHYAGGERAARHARVNRPACEGRGAVEQVPAHGNAFTQAVKHRVGAEKSLLGRVRVKGNPFERFGARTRESNLVSRLSSCHNQDHKITINTIGLR
jgi:hypothetical protein